MKASVTKTLTARARVGVVIGAGVDDIWHPVSEIQVSKLVTMNEQLENGRTDPVVVCSMRETVVESFCLYPSSYMARFDAGVDLTCQKAPRIPRTGTNETQ